MNSVRKRDLTMFTFGLIIFAVIQGLISGGIIGSFWQLNIILICVNVIMAASLNLINGYTGQFSLGHAGFMAVGAYVGVVSTVNFHLPLIVALILGAACAGLLGFLIGLPTLRLRGDYLAIATLGLGEIIRIVIMNIEYVGGAAGFKGIPHLTNFAWVFFAMLFCLFFIKNFVNSSHGRACIAIRENEIAAEAMGVNTTKYKVMAFTIGAAFAGIAGGLFAHQFYQPELIHVFIVVQLFNHGRHGRYGLYNRLNRGRIRRNIYFGGSRVNSRTQNDNLRNRADFADVLPSAGTFRLHGIYELRADKKILG